MAKDPKRPAGGLEGENTGGSLSGFLAEEHQFDRRTLWRVGCWGAVAVSAVIVAVMSNQSSIALRRDEVAAADLARQAQQLQSVARESQNETRRLASAVDTLNSDRDRLYTRMTALEQGLDSVTGAVARQTPNAAPAQVTPAQVTPPPASPATAAPDPQAWLQNLAPAAVPAPVVSPVPASAVKPAEKPVAEAKEAAKATDKPNTEGTTPAPGAIAVATAPARSVDKSIIETKPSGKPAARPITETKAADKPNTEAKVAEKPNPEAAHQKGALAVSSMGPPAAAAPTAPAALPLMAPKSMMPPPDPAAGKLLEPARSATASVSMPKPEAETDAPAERAEVEEPDAASAGVAALQRTEFGVDVGTANSIAGLRALWRGLLKSRSNAALTTLRPIIVVKEGSNGLGMQLRLVAGPLSDAAAAAKICAGMGENNRPCETTIFEGQRLAIKAEDTDAKSPAAKPVPRKRSFPKHIAAPEEPTKPDPPSTISTLFGRR
jgi:hypothetical protein